MNLFDASDPKPPQEKEPPAPPGPPAQRVPKEVLQGFPGLESAVKASLLQRILLWFIPNLTAFIASACIMIIELVASRVIARHLGSSLYTWTSVIGIVLLGITLGNLLGG